MRTNYDRANIQILKEQQESRSKENIKMIEDLMRKRKQGLTLGEKISRHLERIVKKNIVSHIGDSFYERIEEQSTEFYLRRTNLQREDGRTLNVVDEIEVEQANLRRQQEEEEAKDITFEEFKEQFVAHIDGTATNEREAHESADEAAENPKGSQKGGTQSKKATEMNHTSSQLMDKDGDSVDGDRKSAMSRRSGKKSEAASKPNTNSLSKTGDNFKFEIPPSCFVGMMKKVLIEKLHAKYLLASHPYPKIEGELILFLSKKADQSQGKDVIIYRDYSLRKRIETALKANAVDAMAARKKMKSKRDKEDEKPHEPKMQCLEVDITEPLTTEEWQNFIEVIDETQGLGWFQVLPVGQKSSMPMQFNMLHVLPQSKIPVERLPLDTFIANKVSLLRKKERSLGGTAMMNNSMNRQLSAREEMEELATTQGLLMVSEFQFDHCIMQLSRENFVSEGTAQLMDTFKRCSEFLRLATRPDSGLTVVISPRWFFMGLLTQPYAKSPVGHPVYLDGFDFTGLFSMQTTDKTWPATAGLEDQTISILQALHTSTKETLLGDEEEEMDTSSAVNNTGL